MMTVEQLQAELAKLTAENKALVAEQTRKAVFKLKVSEKGAVSIYGLGRFPVTLYRGQMERLLDNADSIRGFIKANESKLVVKGAANGQTTEVAGGATTTIASAPAK